MKFFYIILIFFSMYGTILSAKPISIEIVKGRSDTVIHYFYVDDMCTVSQLKHLLGTNNIEFFIDSEYQDYATMRDILREESEGYLYSLQEKEDTVVVRIAPHSKTSYLALLWALIKQCCAKSKYCTKLHHRNCLIN